MDIRAMAQMEEHSLFSELSEDQINTSKMKAQVAVAIFKRRLELNMTQKEFAEYMNVSQGMVSKWESREYNFTIRSLNEICEKLHLSLNLDMQPVNMVKEYPILKWDEIKQRTKSQKNDWIKKYNMKGAIA